jgi:hypothetical protein
VIRQIRRIRQAYFFALKLVGSRLRNWNSFFATSAVRAFEVEAVWGTALVVVPAVIVRVVVFLVMNALMMLEPVLNAQVIVSPSPAVLARAVLWLRSPEPNTQCPAHGSVIRPCPG